MRKVAIAAAAAALLSATLSQADEPTLGRKGQLIVDADRLVPVIGFSSQSVDAEQGDATTSTTDTGGSIAFLVGREPSIGSAHTVPRLAADYVVAPRLTVGTAFVFAFGIDGAHTEERTPRTGPATVRTNEEPLPTLLGFAPRAGYVLRLSDHFAFWPRAGFAFYTIRSQREETSNLGVTSTATETDTLFSIDLDPEMVWIPFPHVFVHAGVLANLPIAGSHDTDFEQGSDSKDRSDGLTVFHLGITAGMGLWFDL